MKKGQRSFGIFLVLFLFLILAFYEFYKIIFQKPFPDVIINPYVDYVIFGVIFILFVYFIIYFPYNKLRKKKK